MCGFDSGIFKHLFCSSAQYVHTYRRHVPIVHHKVIAELHKQWREHAKVSIPWNDASSTVVMFATSVTISNSPQNFTRDSPPAISRLRQSILQITYMLLCMWRQYIHFSWQIILNLLILSKTEPMNEWNYGSKNSWPQQYMNSFHTHIKAIRSTCMIL